MGDFSKFTTISLLTKMRILFEKAPAAGTVINTGIIMIILVAVLSVWMGYAKDGTTRV